MAKSIILKINNLNYQSKCYGTLEHISFYVNVGEVTSLLGLNNSGRELLFNILAGAVPLGNNKNNIFVRNRTIRTTEEISKETYLIASDEYIIDNWTIAEYLVLQKAPFYLSRKTITSIYNNAQALLQSYDINLDVNKHLSELTIMEKKMLEIIKAGDLNADILLLKDDFEGMSDEMIRSYSCLLHKVIERKNKSVIFLSYIDTASLIISDNSLFFRRGSLVKKCDVNHVIDEVHRNAYLLGHSMTVKKQMLDRSAIRQRNKQKNTIFRIENFYINHKLYSFNFRKGDIVLIKASEELLCRKIFFILSGHTSLKKDTDREVRYYIHNQRLFKTDYRSLFTNKIVSIYRIGTSFGIFENMSVGDNLMISSLCKISSLEYAFYGKSIEESLCQDIKDASFQRSESASSLNINDSILINMERLYIFNPSVLFLFEPFTNCDIYGVSLIKSYIRKFANRGTVVIIIKANIEYLNDSQMDQIIEIN